MKPIRLILVIAFSCPAFSAVAQDLLKSQPPVWAGQPDITAFEKLENKHLAQAQSSIDAIIAIKGLRTIANTLAAYDEAVRHINSAAYLAGLMEQVHSDSTLRDHAMAMLSKASAAQSSLSLHPRPGKYSHAAMFQVLDGVRGKQLPEAALICNFPAPAATEPGLNDYDDVETFFHEFGHLMNWILGGQQRWAAISGLSPEMDFVEAPSQMLEDLLRSPNVLATFARHYKTGEPTPAELVKRMNRASTFLRVGKTAQQNGFAAISFDMYKSNPDKLDPDAICDEDFHRYLFLRMSPGTEHFYASFGHLAEYSSAYYTYMWDKVIVEDFFSKFNPDDPFAGDAPVRYRRLVLEPGASMPASELVKNFLGRPQNMTAFKQWMNAEFETTSAGD